MTTKYIIPIIFMVLLQYFNVAAQGISKPDIDTTILDNWPAVDDPAISPDGKFASYTTDIIAHSVQLKSTMTVQSVTGNWKKTFSSVASNIAFSADSRIAAVLTGDTLCIIHLGNSKTEFVRSVGSFKLIGGKLFYLSDFDPHELTMIDLLSLKKVRYDAVDAYQIFQQGEFLLLEEHSIPRSTNLVLVDLSTGTTKDIWNGTNFDRLFVDEINKKILFTTLATDMNSKISALYCFEMDMNKAQLVTSNLGALIGNDWEFENFREDLSAKGGCFFKAYQPETPLMPIVGEANVNLWSYRDQKIYPRQLEDGHKEPDYTFAFSFANNKIVRIEQDGDQIISQTGNFVLLEHHDRGWSFGSDFWAGGSKPGFYIINLIDGKKKYTNAASPSVSLSGKYLIWFNPALHNYLTYELRSGITANITKKINTSWASYQGDNPNSHSEAGDNIDGWTSNDGFVLLHDQFDQWMVDPAGLKAPVNVTNYYGKLNHIAFRLAIDHRKTPISASVALLYTAFNRTTKENGFFVKNIHADGDPEKLTMGPYCYEITDDIDNTGMTPLKAADADAYIVQRMSSTESPNYFYTTDFKTFKQLSDVHPETAYNWLTSELINWPLPDGTISQGVLYKPQNFDPKKKYPVIFYYYEKFSDKLNTYLPVQPSSGTINIPWFVSHGYLVFTPDIHYKIGYPGNSALNAVVSAARYLSSLSYVDSLNMGIQGQSFGGYETNYIVTHSNLFKAACSVSGLSDIVSFYTGIWGSTNPADFVEMGQLRMGQKLWDDPGLYIENSPVFFANRVTTPILLMCNENDPAFYLQGISFFNALRRLGKRVWMLQYDKEGHELEKDVDTKDYTIRLSQFFDYYLKAQRAPDWMIEGVPAYKKGYDAGLELEPTGVAPGTGLLSIEEQRRVDSLQFRKPITVTIN